MYTLLICLTILSCTIINSLVIVHVISKLDKITTSAIKKFGKVTINKTINVEGIINESI